METKDFKFRLDDIDEEKGAFTGIASVYDVIDAYNETVARGAFQKTLKDNDGKFPLCWFHSVADPLGIIVAKDKSHGLEIEGHLNLDVQSAREKRSLMKQGAISGLSIGFRTVKDEWEGNVRKLKEIKLHEISLITRNFQACPGAEIGDVKDGLPAELKPYPNEHAARLQDPGKFDKFRRKADGTLFNKVKVPDTIDVIWGHLKDGEDDDWAAQALRFPVKNWTAAEARAWLKENDVKYMGFEAAEKSLDAVLERVLSIESVDSLSKEGAWLITQTINHLETLLDGKEPLEIGTLGPGKKPLFDDYLSELRKLNSTFGG